MLFAVLHMADTYHMPPWVLKDQLVMEDVGEYIAWMRIKDKEEKRARKRLSKKSRKR